MGGSDQERVNVTVHDAPRPALPAEQLIRDCLALGSPGLPRVPASVRLEEALGPDLARRLLSTLTVGSRG